MSEALQRIEPQQSMALDAVGRKAAIDDLINKVALVQEVMTKVMHENEHYGVIPGCGSKPALLKAGAEKLGMTFRLKATFDVQERDLGHAHREYSIRCLLSDGNMGVGSCSTMESKYRYRQGERKCPECGKATIRQSKKDDKHPAGGFYCWAKIGGCGTQFTESDERISGQQVGKVEHDNPADFYNTCLKMGKKRAHVDAIITATACSDIFTQDVEEMVQNSVIATSEPATTKQPPTITIESAPKSEPTMMDRVAKAKAEVMADKKPAPASMSTGNGEQTFPVVQVLAVKEVHSKPDAPKKWTAYFVRFSDGFVEMEAASFDKKIADVANDLANTQENAVLVTRPGRKEGSKEIVSLKRAEQPPAEDNVPMNFDAQGNPVEETIP